MKRKSKQTEPPAVAVPIGRLGPPRNLRPAGAFRDRRHTTRAADKAALNKAAFDIPALLGGSYAHPRCG
jgi:hypothetical protein